MSTPPNLDATEAQHWLVADWSEREAWQKLSDARAALLKCKAAVDHTHTRADD